MKISMDELILSNLEQFYDELDLIDSKKNELVNYNNQFRQKLISKSNALQNDEYIAFTDISNIVNSMEVNKQHFYGILDGKKVVNGILMDEKNVRNREIYEADIKKITSKIDEESSIFNEKYKEIQQISHFKNLETKKKKQDYETQLFDIKENYTKVIEYFHDKKIKEFEKIDLKIQETNEETNGTLNKIEEIFNKQISLVDDENSSNHEQIKKDIQNREKSLLSKKILINEEIDKISKKFRIHSERELTSIKNHILFLENNSNILKQELNDTEIKYLDTFKLNLEIIDKQIDIYKLKTQEKINEINKSSKNKQEILKIEHELNIYLEEMRNKKIQYDINKTFDINKLNVEYLYNKKHIDKSIELFQKQYSNIETIYNINESLEINKLRNELEVQELKLQKDCDVIKQDSYILDAKDKLNSEYHNTLYKKQMEIQNYSIEYNRNFFEAQKNNLSTVTSLEIEKNLILKNYNLCINTLLNKENDLTSSLIKIDEQYQISKEKLYSELNQKLLTQDIQFSNKKIDLLKKLVLLEREFNDQVLLNETNHLVELDTFNIFEKRFNSERNLYDVYFEYCKHLIETLELYLTKYNMITKCKNKNISFNILKYLFDFLQEELEENLIKITKVVSHRISFEATINFQYELNHLMHEKEQNTIMYKATVKNRKDTLENYKRTLSNYTTKTFFIQKQLDKTKNQLIIKDMEYANTDVKNSTLINKLSDEIEILKNSISEYEKEIKGYSESILRNNKLIDELEKSIPELKKKYNKSNTIISNKLLTIEKRHKQDSSVYTTFVDDINELIKTIKKEIDFNEIKGSVHSYFKEIIDFIHYNIVDFQNNNVNGVVSKVEIRHEESLIQSENKRKKIQENTKELYQSNIKQTSSLYNEEIFEIEKKVDKINSLFELKTKEMNVKYKDKCTHINNNIEAIHEEMNVYKSKLLYNVNTFMENISEHTKTNTNSIEDIKNNRRVITKNFFEYSDILKIENEKKLSKVGKNKQNLDDSFEFHYQNLIKDKINSYYKKEHSYKIRINELVKSYKTIVNEYNSFIPMHQENKKIEISILEKDFSNTIDTNNKKYLVKVNKENKKFNKNIKTNS